MRDHFDYVSSLVSRPPSSWSTMKQWKVVAAMLAVWVCVLLYITSTMPLPSSPASSSSLSPFSLRSGGGRDVREDALREAELAAEKAANSLAQTLDEMQVLQNQNAELRKLITEYRYRLIALFPFSNFKVQFTELAALPLLQFYHPYRYFYL